ncbi:MAG TPA: alpha-2-macroglobulin family protein, partial [Dehalococcoidia bacterium]|nr:alpha-2-macroglobulin family protein [Dehalococcoidia bacterium]
PAAKLLVYQVLPNAEIAADYIPFKVVAAYPQDVNVEFSTEEAKPGADVSINIQTEGQAKVGIVAVDRSVFILAENRLNLQQVFDDLERLFMQPQAELHEVSLFQSIETRGASETFRDAGVVVLSNKSIPQGQQYKKDVFGAPGGIFDGRGVLEAQGAVPPVPVPAAAPAGQSLAEVQRIRQFFPETWLWQEVTTNANGKASVQVTVPDTITTWMLRAVALSKSQGLGVAEAQLKAFQPFFLSVDLPYSAVRGEEFPLRVAVYNYLDTAQSVVVQVQPADWFDLLDSAQKTVAIGPNDIGSVQFKIRPKKLGVNGVQVTARSAQAADAVVKTVIVEPEGVARELVDNLVLSAGTTTLDASLPEGIVPGSGRAYVTLTSSYLTQTIDGLETLLQMPFGCGEQNMIVFAPDVFITRYLKESGQLKPEIMAKAEKLMLTGYQRELTYRRSDGSFSAFGQSDPEGSLWLTAFVLKSFAQADGLIYIDSGVLDSAKAWIVSHQNADGSFDAVGFVHHQEMMGGVSGKTALTAYVAAALMQSGEKAGSAKAVKYLETKLDGIDDAYTMALTSYALELAGSSKAADAYAQLMKMAKEDENGLHWGDDIQPLEPPTPQPKGLMLARPMPVARTADIEATGYATMALVKHGDRLNAGKAARWLVSKRNAYGGFGSTQDTVVGLEALTQYATGVRTDVDLTVTVDAGGNAREYKVNSENFDVLQLVEVPTDGLVTLKVVGNGQAVGQLVRRFSAPEAEGKAREALKIDVKYDTNQVAVNDLVNVSVDVAFSPLQPMEAGMVVVDISVPTGFAPVTESIDRAVKQEKKISRYDIAGRKVIFYVENMLPGDTIHFSFDVKARYPVKAKGVSSQAYSYYKPELSGETLGQDMVVV